MPDPSQDARLDDASTVLTKSEPIIGKFYFLITTTGKFHPSNPVHAAALLEAKPGLPIVIVDELGRREFKDLCELMAEIKS